MELEIISLSLQKTDFEFDLYFPQEIFHKMVDYASCENKEFSDPEKEATACINGEDSHDYSIIAPVFIMDLINPTSDFTVTDAEGAPLSVPNRFATSTIWGLQLFSTFNGICRAVAGAEGSEAANDKVARELIELLDDEDNAVSVLKVLSALAWIAAADTSERFQRFDINRYSQLFDCLHGVKNPSALFYKGLPLEGCSVEQAAARLFGWAVQEISLVEGEPLQYDDGLDKHHGEIFTKIIEMVRIQQEIERKTYEERERLRAMLEGERYETVFEQTCPVTNPLLYIRAYIKRYMHAVEIGELEGVRKTGMQLLAEYVDHALVYLRVIRNLVALVIELAGMCEVTARERAKRGLYILNHLCLAYNTWRVFAFLEISPETRKKVTLTTHVHTDDNSQYRERDGLEHLYIKTRSSWIKNAARNGGDFIGKRSVSGLG
ncbi:MAG: hypothetical protein HPY75_15180 [Actinobacteria bacterium]|nr:hypothetical protein [Actinomycetota bacterium]